MIPAFEATYAASGISPIDRRPITDATLTIEPPPPPPSRIAFAARQASANGAVRLRSSTRANASALVRRAGPVAPAPALLTRPSRRPGGPGQPAPRGSA